MTASIGFNDAGTRLYTKEEVTRRFFNAHKGLDQSQKNVILERAEKLALFCKTPSQFSSINVSIENIKSAIRDKTKVSPTKTSDRS